MARLTISMPDPMSDYVDAQIASGRYGNVSEYFRDLIRREQDRRAMAITELRALVERAEASGVDHRSVAEILDGARAKAHAGASIDG